MSPKHMIVVGAAIAAGILSNNEFGVSIALGIGVGMALAGLIRVWRERANKEVTNG